MSVRTDIQRKVSDLLQGGTFTKVEYDMDNLPVDTGIPVAPRSVVVNELSGGLSDTSSKGATSSDFVITDWRFEARAEFTSEVTTDTFLISELHNIAFSSGGLLLSIAPSGDFRVAHPTREGSHNGTKITIGLTVNTRR